MVYFGSELDEWMAIEEVSHRRKRKSVINLSILCPVSETHSNAPNPDPCIHPTHV